MSHGLLYSVMNEQIGQNETSRNPMDSSCGNFVNARGRSRDGGGGFLPCTVGPETGQNHYLGLVQFPLPANCARVGRNYN